MDSLFAPRVHSLRSRPWAVMLNAFGVKNSAHANSTTRLESIEPGNEVDHIPGTWYSGHQSPPGASCPFIPRFGTSPPSARVMVVTL